MKTTNISINSTTPIIISLILDQPREEVRRTTFNCARVGFSYCGDKAAYEICDGLSDLSTDELAFVQKMIRQYRKEIGKDKKVWNGGLVN